MDWKKTTHPTFKKVMSDLVLSSSSAVCEGGEDGLAELPSMWVEEDGATDSLDFGGKRAAGPSSVQEDDAKTKCVCTCACRHARLVEVENELKVGSRLEYMIMRSCLFLAYLYLHTYITTTHTHLFIYITYIYIYIYIYIPHTNTPPHT